MKENNRKSLKVAASILSADFSRLADEIRSCEAAGIDLIHIDVMDGHFVPNITIGPLIVKALRPLTRLPLEAHLMIENPGQFIESFVRAGADIITLHAECYGRLRSGDPSVFPWEVDGVDLEKAMRDIRKVTSLGAKAAMALNPGTPSCFSGLMNELSLVLVMSVNPGFSGQKFMPVVLPKITAIRKVFSGDIAVDGGINQGTAGDVVRAGANVLVTASHFFEAQDKQAVVRHFKASH